MNLLKIVIDKKRKLSVKNSPDLTVHDLCALAGVIVDEISNQTGKSYEQVTKEINRMLTEVKTEGTK